MKIIRRTGQSGFGRVRERSEKAAIGIGILSPLVQAGCLGFLHPKIQVADFSREYLLILIVSSAYCSPGSWVE